MDSWDIFSTVAGIGVAIAVVIWLVRAGAQVERDMEVADSRAVECEATVLAWSVLQRGAQVENPKPPRVEVHLRIHATSGDYVTDTVWTLGARPRQVQVGTPITVAVDPKHPGIAFPRVAGVTLAAADFALGRQKAARA